MIILKKNLASHQLLAEMSSNINLTDQIFKVAENGSVKELHQINLRYRRFEIAVSLTKVNENLLTPVQLAISNKNFDVIAYMLKPLKFSIGNQRFRPACRSVIYQIIVNTQLSIIEKMECLMGTELNSDCWLEFVWLSISSSTCITRQEKIVALELIGATFFVQEMNHEFFYFDHPGSNNAEIKASHQDRVRSSEFTNTNQNVYQAGIQCWKEAMALRNIEPAFPKIADLFPDDDTFNNTTELMSMEDLDLFQRRCLPVNNDVNLQDKRDLIRIHCLLVTKRILNQLDPGKRPFGLYLHNLLRYRNYCWNKKLYSRSLSTSLLILEKLDGFNSSSSPKCIKIFTSTLFNIPACLKKMTSSLPNSAGKIVPSSANIFCIVKSYIDTLKLVVVKSNVINIPDWKERLEQEQILQFMKFFVYFMKFLHFNDWFPNFKTKENKKLTENLSQYFRLNLRQGIPSLLHLALEGPEILNYWGYQRPFTSAHMDIVRWFLEAGANPNISICQYGNIYIPVVVLIDSFGEWKWGVCKKSFWICFQNLLDAGTHLNKVMPNGETIFEYLKKQLFKRFGSPYYPNLDSTSVPPLPLSYLCSRVIRFHDIPIENQLPPRLQFFVRHSSTFLGNIKNCFGSFLF